MRVGKISWVKHSNLPILSVDVQPNGYRFVTGGGDGVVCVWNLLPVISEKYEQFHKKNMSEEEKNDVDMEDDSMRRDDLDQNGSHFS
jgi:WD40 repeat protein